MIYTQSQDTSHKATKFDGKTVQWLPLTWKKVSNTCAMPPRKRRTVKSKPETSAATSKTATKGKKSEPAAKKAKQETKPETSAATSKAATKGKKSEPAAKKAKQETKPETLAAASKAAAKGKKSEPAAQQEKIDEVFGTAPVDKECPLAEKSHVFSDTDGIWDCMLNESFIEGNHNKYFMIQLLKNNKKCEYSVWTRWGRVGSTGRTQLTQCGSDLVKAKKAFSKKFKDKTKNDWYKRKDFAKLDCYHDLLEMDYGTRSHEPEVVNSAVAKLQEVPESKLDKRLQDLIQLISDVKTMEDVMKEMKLDAKRSPLGKLSSKQIMKGYEALKEIEGLILTDNTDRTLIFACNKFYTRIPHDFGMKDPERIVALNKVQEKILLLPTLDDIEMSMSLVSKAIDSYKGMNPIDQTYLSLKCDIRPMEKSEEMYKILERYLKNPHEPTCWCNWSLTLMDIFQCDKDEDYSSTVGNKILLWHGSRPTNCIGIISQGLKKPPPVTRGFVYEKGIYFSDCACDGAYYCRPIKDDGIGLLFLCEVKLGNLHQMTYDEWNHEGLPNGAHAFKACGTLEPDASGAVTINDDVTVPCGKIQVKTKDAQEDPKHNEYIVYNTNQVKLRYILKVKFKDLR